MLRATALTCAGAQPLLLADKISDILPADCPGGACRGDTTFITTFQKEQAVQYKRSYAWTHFLVLQQAGSDTSWSAQGLCRAGTPEYLGDREMLVQASWLDPLMKEVLMTVLRNMR